jgi:hypothetical protein
MEADRLCLTQLDVLFGGVLPGFLRMYKSQSGGFKTLYIKPSAPWQNAYSESFNSRFRDEFLNREAFGGQSAR